MVSFCFGEPSSFGLAPLSADSCSGRVQTLPFRHHARARRKSEAPQEAPSASESLSRPENRRRKNSPQLCPAPDGMPPLFSSALCLHPATARYIRLNEQNECFLPETAGDSLFPSALPTEKHSFLPAVCRRKGTLRNQPSCLRASVSRHLHGQ